VLARDGESGRDRCLRREAGGSDRTVRLDVLVGHSIDAGSGRPGTNAGTTEYASINTAGHTAGDHATAHDAATDDAAPHATNAAHTTGGTREVVG